MKRFFRLLSVPVMCLMMLFSLCVNTYAEERKTVRVGYVIDYLDDSEITHKTGSSYEYLQKISCYTGWQYEYSYGTHDELVTQLMAGQIDLLTDMPYIEEYTDRIDYSSYVQKNENYYLYANENNNSLTDITPEEVETLTVGVVDNSFQNEMWYKWQSDRHIEAHTVYYPSRTELIVALINNEVDAMVMGSRISDYGFRPLYHVGEGSLYFAVSEGNEILDELNDALEQIITVDPDYNESLVLKYTTTEVDTKYPNEKEAAWLKEHDNTIRIGYMTDNMPYSDVDEDGNVTGILSVLVSQLENTYGVTVKTIPFSSVKEMTEADRDGLIDLVGPNFGDFALCEQNEKLQSDPISTTTLTAVYRDELSFDSIAVCDSRIMYHDAVLTVYPDAELTLFDNEFDAIRSVYRGYTDTTLILTSQIGSYRDNEILQRLKTAEIVNQVELCMFSSVDNAALITLVNKAIALSRIDLSGSALKDEEVNTMSVQKFLSQNSVFLSCLAVLIIAMLVFFIYYYAKMEKEAMVAKEQAQAANRAKSTFLFNMSHDLRTPMNVILGYSQLAMEHPDDPEKVKKYLSSIEHAGGILLSIINNVLELARIESGKITMETETVNLEDDWRETLNMFEQPCLEKNIRLVSSCELIHPIHTICRTQYTEILMNLMSNAIKYTPENGIVSCHVKEMDDGIHLEVSDTGIGMSEEFLDHVFEQFEREHNTTYSGVEGTGLGMRIVSQLIQKLNGKIKVESTKGVGTTVRVLLPACPASVSELPQKTEKKISEREHGNHHVLVVEDNELNAEIVSEMLKAEGVQVTAARNGQQCLDLLKQKENHYDLILMDIQMPGLNGYETTEMIRNSEDETVRNIPIAALTANAFEEDKEAAMKAGMNAHLGKPVRREQLKDLLDQFLG